MTTPTDPPDTPASEPETDQEREFLEAYRKPDEADHVLMWGAMRTKLCSRSLWRYRQARTCGGRTVPLGRGCKPSQEVFLPADDMHADSVAVDVALVGWLIAAQFPR